MDPSRIHNSEVLTSVFGTWPSFHDAEVVALRLDRSGMSGPEMEADIHVFEMTSEVTPEGFYRLRNHTLVTVLFTGIEELSMDDFNQQNVLSDLVLKDISQRQPEVLKWEVVFAASFGLAAKFLCEAISVLRAEPLQPSSPAPSPRGTRSGARPLE
jgi:Immunity protein 50